MNSWYEPVPRCLLAETELAGGRSGSHTEKLRSTPRGGSVLSTDAGRFASLSKAAVEDDPSLQRPLAVVLPSFSPPEPSPSAYLRVSTRFKDVFNRLR
jgi:hypothetical protein